MTRRADCSPESRYTDPITASVALALYLLHNTRSSSIVEGLGGERREERGGGIERRGEGEGEEGSIERGEMRGEGEGRERKRWRERGKGERSNKRERGSDSNDSC